MDQSLLKGWNTFYTRSVLTHVRMPNGFAVSLGFKNYSSGAVLTEALIGRFEEGAEQITPGLRSYDGTYTCLSIRWHGTETVVESTEQDGSLYLLATPVKMEQKPMALLMEGAVLWSGEGCVRREGETLRAELPGEQITLWTDGDPLPEKNAGFTGPYLSVELSRPVAMGTGPGAPQRKSGPCWTPPGKRWKNRRPGTGIWRRPTPPCRPAWPGTLFTNRKPASSARR